jgi:HflK protein
MIKLFKQLTNSTKKIFLLLYKLSKRTWYKVSDAVDYCHSCVDIIISKMFRKPSTTKPSTAPMLKRGGEFLKKAFVIIIVFSIIAIATWFWLRVTAFEVPAGSTAVVTRFGKAVREVNPGLNFRIPIIEKYYMVNSSNVVEQYFGFVKVANPVQNQEQLEVTTQAQQQNASPITPATSSSSAAITPLPMYIHQFGTAPNSIVSNAPASAGVPSHPHINSNGQLELPQLGKIMTGNLEIVDVRWTLQYSINDGIDYLFSTRDINQVLRSVARSSMSEVIGDMTATKALQISRDDIGNSVKTLIEEKLKLLHLQVDILKVIVLDILPPEPVMPAYEQINSAMQTQYDIIYQSEKNYLTQTITAQGQAQKLISEAQSYAVSTINLAQGQSKRFASLLASYEHYPKVTRDRLYLEALEQLVGKTPNIVIDKALKGILPIYPASDTAPQNQASATGTVAAIAGNHQPLVPPPAPAP